jgi:Tfp pilus assembly protein PilF
VPFFYSRVADAQIRVGDLDAAEQAIEAGSRIDPSEPCLWVSRARLQQARNMPQLALASVNYALAIWKDADEAYVMVKRAHALARELQSVIQQHISP